MKKREQTLDRTVPKERKAFKRFICFILAIVILFVSTSGVYFALVINKLDINEKNPCGNVYISQDKLKQSDDVTNILLLGVDRRSKEESQYRSDTMIMLSLDRRHNKIKITSFLRDSWVYIPEYGYQRLNAACTYGGYELVMDTIEYNFKVDIDSYVLVDFDMFSHIVDSMNGIDLEITKQEAEYMNSTGYPQIVAGDKVHLNGEEALWYTRIRHLDSDFMRTSRQRKTIEALINKAKKANIIKLLETMYTIAPLVETDLTKEEIMKLALNTSIYIISDVEEFQVPMEGTYKNSTIDSNKVLEVDIDANKNGLIEFIYN